MQMMAVDRVPGVRLTAGEAESPELVPRIAFCEDGRLISLVRAPTAFL